MCNDMRRLFGLLTIILLSLPSTAQISVSPYSIFGNGDQASDRFVYQDLMGGIQSGLRDPLQMNIGQPASYSALEYATIEIGGFYQNTYLSDASQSLTSRTGGFSYVAFGFRLTDDWGMSFGLTPETNIGYDIRSRADLGFSGAEIQYQGVGGYNRGYFGMSYEFFDRLSIGVNGNYIFGAADRSTIALMDDRNFYSTAQVENIRGSGFTYNAGIQYSHTFGPDSLSEFVIGATYKPNAVIDGTLNDLFYTFTVQNNTGIRTPKDTVYNIDDESVDVIFNSNYGAGFSYGKRHSRLLQYAWSISGDYQMYGRSELNTSSELRGEYQDGYRIALGGQFIPYYALDMNQGSYLSQVDYRAGLYYESTGLMLNEQVITDRGLSLGFGLPLGRRTATTSDVKIASLNIGMILGQRGNRTDGNLQEVYTRFVVGLTLNDKWFTQFKYR